MPVNGETRLEIAWRGYYHWGRFVFLFMPLKKATTTSPNHLNLYSLHAQGPRNTGLSSEPQLLLSLIQANKLSGPVRLSISQGFMTSSNSHSDVDSTGDLYPSRSPSYLSFFSGGQQNMAQDWSSGK
ncbi:hypothetical protein Tco_1105203 [Tanacetum coccineum]